MTAETALLARLDTRAGFFGCWPFRGSRNTDGYGRLRSAGRSDYAHRVAFRCFVGPIPPGLFVCHHCDNPPCCNPTHLFLGTAADNHRDALLKGRVPLGFKLTSEQIAFIRTSDSPPALLARFIGTSKRTVYRVREATA